VPAIVPPVQRMTTLGSLAGAASSADAKDTCANVESAAHKTTSFDAIVTFAALSQ
jgi:hypothetical protein